MTNELMKEKCKYFFDNKIPVHIIKHNKFFHNGLILELQGDLLIIDDRKKWCYANILLRNS